MINNRGGSAKFIRFSGIILIVKNMQVGMGKMYFIAYKKSLALEIRSKFNLSNELYSEYAEHLKRIFKEVVIINTCNRLEIYFVPIDKYFKSEDVIDSLFQVFSWEDDLKKYLSIYEEEKTIKHLMEVACGFHSRILGEDQILSQIKEALSIWSGFGLACETLQKLFLESITCGKKFRKICSLNEIPVSISSITVKKTIEDGRKRVLLIGYGEIGKLTLKYLIQEKKLEKIYILRKSNNIDYSIKDKRVEFINYDKKQKIINNVDSIICCTNNSSYVLYENEMDKRNHISIFDLALPPDVEENISKLQNIKFYDIDTLSKMDYNNKLLRKERILKNKFIVDEYVDEFKNWKKSKKIFPVLKKFNDKKKYLVDDRAATFANKKDSKDEEKLIKTLLNSVANSYVNKAIEVLKEETLKGREKECIKILEKIFL